MEQGGCDSSEDAVRVLILCISNSLVPDLGKVLMGRASCRSGKSQSGRRRNIWRFRLSGRHRLAACFLTGTYSKFSTPRGGFEQLDEQSLNFRW
jgi:hypothetical protein